MATTSNRAETVERVVEILNATPNLLRADGQRVQVLDGPDFRSLEDEAVVVGEISGANEIPVMKAGRKTRDDKFTVDVFIRANQPGQATATAARKRAQVLYAVIEDALADSPSLNDLDGVLVATLDTVDGPDAEPTNEGWQAAMLARLSVHSRLT